MCSEYECCNVFLYIFLFVFFFFFKQKTAYEMRISDWSSDVRSSDLGAGLACLFHPCFDQAEIFVEDRVLQVDAQRQDAVQPPLDRGQGLGEPPALPGQVQTGERLELIEVDRLEFCLEQPATPLVERLPREVGLQIVAGVEKPLPAGQG